MRQHFLSALSSTVVLMSVIRVFAFTEQTIIMYCTLLMHYGKYVVNDN